MPQAISGNGRIAVLGAGLIGAGWAALFALRGYRVIVVDAQAGARNRVADALARARPVMAAQGQLVGQAHEPEFVVRIDEAMADVMLVQEALPEQLSVKQQAYAALEKVVAAQVPIASSSSGLLPSALQDRMRHPERLLIAHPCNPPYLMPVVELVGGRLTHAQVMERAARFYRGLGKQVVRLRREVTGHLINRLQAALWREATYLVAQGYADVADVDRAVTEGLGARWAVCGPHEVFHLAGAEQGMEGFLDRLGQAVEAWWQALGNPVLDAATRRCLIQGMQAAADGKTVAALAAERDRRMIEILRAKASIAQADDAQTSISPTPSRNDH